MAFDAFLKIDGIPGESTDDKHKDWIEILTFDLGAQQPVSYTASSAGGATAERVNIDPFSITKEVDNASPKLFEAATTGKHIKEVVLEVWRAGSEKQKYLEVRLEQALIADYQLGGGGGLPTESVKFAPGRIKLTYFKQNRVDGIASGAIAAGWDLIANKFFA